MFCHIFFSQARGAFKSFLSGIYFGVWNVLEILFFFLSYMDYQFFWPFSLNRTCFIHYTVMSHANYMCGVVSGLSVLLHYLLIIYTQMSHFN